MANQKELTETECLALCIASPLDGAETFGANEAEEACGILASLFQAKRVDAKTFARVNARIGNHSALRQWAIKMGLLTAKEIAEDALCKEVKRLHALDKEALTKMLE